MFIIMWQSQDVRISGSGFFTVDLSLIVSVGLNDLFFESTELPSIFVGNSPIFLFQIISTVVTYTVILVQVKSYRPCFTDCFCKNNSTRIC